MGNEKYFKIPVAINPQVQRKDKKILQRETYPQVTSIHNMHIQLHHIHLNSFFMSSPFGGVRFRQLPKDDAKRIQLQSVFKKTASHVEYFYDLRIPFIWSFT